MEQIKPIFFFVPFLLLVFTNCNKQEEPKPISGTPVFYLDATLDSENLGLEAGLNGYFLQSLEYEDLNKEQWYCWKLQKS